MNEGTKNIAHVLWTGGWDSSFRILDLVLKRGATVQPWYIIDEERASSGTEIDTMLALRVAVAARDAGAAARLLPTQYRERSVLTVDPFHSDALRTLNKERGMHMGSQYKWLADCAATEHLDALEVSVHRDDNSQLLLESYVEPVDTPYGPNYQLQPSYEDPHLALFKRFRFPLLDWTKLEMGEYAAAHGFGDLMERTWFCHNPKNGRPCGMCNPCGFVVKEGLGRRVPRVRQFKRRLRTLKRKVMNRDSD